MNSPSSIYWEEDEEEEVKEEQRKQKWCSERKMKRKNRKSQDKHIKIETERKKKRKRDFFLPSFHCFLHSLVKNHQVNSRLEPQSRWVILTRPQLDPKYQQAEKKKRGAEGSHSPPKYLLIPDHSSLQIQTNLLSRFTVKIPYYVC